MTVGSSSNRTALARFNTNLAAALLALWPEENKPWGIAFISELSAIDSPKRQFCWLLGGIPVLLREAFHSFLRSLGRPIGVGPSDMVPDTRPQNGRSPRTPRLVLALLFLLVIVLLAQSPTRAIFRSVSQAHTSSGWDASQWPEVQRIQSLAEKSLSTKNPDPQLLAFASVTFSDEDKRLFFADAAIQADPQLAWMDYQNVILPRDITRQYALSADRFARLQTSDSGNALLDLLRAESIALAYRVEDARNDPGAHHIADWGKSAFHDPRWLAAMDAAFRAPRYDTYDAKLFELSRDVVKRYSVNDPRILFSILGRRPLGPYLAIHNYSKMLFARAVQAQHSGDAESAIQTCSLVLAFAQRLRVANFYQLETWTANDLKAEAYPLLQSAYENAGRHQDALAIAAQLQQNREERLAFASQRRLLSQSSFVHWSRSEWAALLMQSSVFAIWILLPLSLLSIILPWFWRSRLRVSSGLFHTRLCLLADSCPYLLALATVILFVTYVPYDHAYRQSLQASFSPASYQEFANAARAPFSLPPSLLMTLESLTGPHGRFLLWSALTTVLALLALKFALRLLRKSATPRPR